MSLRGLERIHPSEVTVVGTTELHKTAFDEVQREAGANWTDWEGWAWAADFGDAIAEHSATRNACNLWDESPLRKWDMKGPDALALADALFTNDMAALEPGQVRYGAICDEQGRMIMDGTIFKYSDDHCFSITSYDSDLDFVFPAGCGVFRAGGDLAYLHGGPSLQELVIPVLTVRVKVRDTAKRMAGPVTASANSDRKC